jgi:hypothetical protein
VPNGALASCFGAEQNNKYFVSQKSAIALQLDPAFTARMHIISLFN